MAETAEEKVIFFKKSLKHDYLKSILLIQSNVSFTYLGT